MKNGNFIAAAMVLELLRNSHDAGWGATIGLLLGMFIPPVGIILGTGMKLIVSGLMLWKIMVYMWDFPKTKNAISGLRNCQCRK